MLRLLMLFRICEHIGYAHKLSSVDVKRTLKLNAIYVLRPLMNSSAQQEIDESYDL